MGKRERRDELPPPQLPSTRDAGLEIRQSLAARLYHVAAMLQAEGERLVALGWGLAGTLAITRANEVKHEALVLAALVRAPSSWTVHDVYWRQRVQEPLNPL